MKKGWKRARKRIYEVIEVGNDFDLISRLYDILNVVTIVVNLVVSIMLTFDAISIRCGSWMGILEKITVIFFAIDFFLRLITVKCMFPERRWWSAARGYIFSFTGIIDILSFVPYFLPIFFPGGAVAFRMVRIVRVFRLFRINAYYDSLSIIIQVIVGKSQQLLSSVFIILVLMMASSLCMYSIEHEAQPDVFTNAFSGMWWAASTLLTVGYGDIYPVTVTGKIFGIFITFLGVGMVAIPTGIISAGFVDQYSDIKKRMNYGYEEDMHFIKVPLIDNDKWIGKRIADLILPSGMIIAIVKRGDELIIPRGDVVLNDKDTVVLGAIPFDDRENITLKEVVLKKNNPWTGIRIRDLDISRQSVIVLVKRKNKSLIPNGNMILEEGDRVFIYTKMHFPVAREVSI